MNKYIDNLTIKEYEEIEKFLKKLEPIENEKMKRTGNTKEYVELRFVILKIQNIIKKYKKKI